MSALTTPGIPEAISREALTALVESLGINSDHLASLTLDGSGVRAEVYATNDEGRVVANFGRPAMHSIFIPVKDDLEPPARSAHPPAP